MDGIQYRRSVLRRERVGSSTPLAIESEAFAPLVPGNLRLKVRACGVCRTDLHITAGELKPLRDAVVPGHQIVGEVVDGATAERPLGMRVGVSWLASTDGTCWYCRNQRENLCDQARFTGYDLDGGYAEYALAAEKFVYPIPEGLSDGTYTLLARSPKGRFPDQRCSLWVGTRPAAAPRTARR